MSIDVLYTPQSYYDRLLSLVEAANNRIILSALYLGTGHLENRLLLAIKKRMESRPDLHVEFRLDARRGTRRGTDGMSSEHFISETLGHRVRVKLYRVSSLSRIERAIDPLLPARVNEILGCYHAKYAIFDDSVIISGANLSADYFTNRQDRYVQFSECKDVADFLHSYCLAEDSTNRQDRLLTLGITSDYEGQLKLSWPKKDCSSDVNFALSAVRTAKSLGFMSAYFNPPKELTRAIASLTSMTTLDVITSSPECNGFFKSRGFSGLLPDLYTESLGSFMKRFSNQKSVRARALLYARHGWTFHGKGVYGFDADGNAIGTTVGSSNFGYRSFSRDFELHVSLGLRSKPVQQMLNEEYHTIASQCRLFDAHSLKVTEGGVARCAYRFSKLVRSLL